MSNHQNEALLKEAAAIKAKDKAKAKELQDSTKSKGEKIESTFGKFEEGIAAEEAAWGDLAAARRADAPRSTAAALAATAGAGPVNLRKAQSVEGAARSEAAAGIAEADVAKAQAQSTGAEAMAEAGYQSEAAHKSSVADELSTAFDKDFAGIMDQETGLFGPDEEGIFSAKMKSIHSKYDSLFDGDVTNARNYNGDDPYLKELAKQIVAKLDEVHREFNATNWSL